MELDGKLLARARERLETQRAQRETQREALEREIFERSPELRRLDGRLRSAMGELISAVARGADPRELRRIEDQALALRSQRAGALTALGYAPDALETGFACPRCCDTGYLPDGRPCDCLLTLYGEERSRQLSSLAQAGDRGFAAFDLSYYSGEDRERMALNLSICKDFVRSFGPDSPDLLFQGGTGLGKTLMSRIIAAAVAEAGYSVVYETAQSAFSAFEDQKFSRDSEAYAQAGERVRRILGCELLILDDLGTELTTSFTQSALYNIVDSRLNSRKKTVISTNLTDEELARRYIPQIVSRLRGEYDALLFRGRDIRAIRNERRYL